MSKIYPLTAWESLASSDTDQLKINTNLGAVHSRLSTLARKLFSFGQREETLTALFHTCMTWCKQILFRIPSLQSFLCSSTVCRTWLVTPSPFSLSIDTIQNLSRKKTFLMHTMDLEHKAFLPNAQPSRLASQVTCNASLTSIKTWCLKKSIWPTDPGTLNHLKSPRYKKFFRDSGQL